MTSFLERRADETKRNCEPPRAKRERETCMYSLLARSASEKHGDRASSRVTRANNNGFRTSSREARPKKLKIDPYRTRRPKTGASLGQILFGRRDAPLGSRRLDSPPLLGPKKKAGRKWATCPNVSRAQLMWLFGWRYSFWVAQGKCVADNHLFCTTSEIKAHNTTKRNKWISTFLARNASEQHCMSSLPARRALEQIMV